MSDNKKSGGLKFSSWWITGAIIFMFILLNIFYGTNMQDPTKISSSKFDELLNSGQIEKVIVFNKTQAEAYLTAAAQKDKANKKVSKDLFGNPNKGPHYVFEIADAQNFENKLHNHGGI